MFDYLVLCWMFICLLTCMCILKDMLKCTFVNENKIFFSKPIVNHKVISILNTFKLTLTKGKKKLDLSKVKEVTDL